MPRPRKWRKVCCLPHSNLYGPLNEVDGKNEIVLMTVEEYETIRLIDLETLTQEECAERMQVARATVQKIYTVARGKIAQSIVNGDILKIEGGDYQLYSDQERMHGCRICRGNRCCRNFIEDKSKNEEKI